MRREMKSTTSQVRNESDALEIKYSWTMYLNFTMTRTNLVISSTLIMLCHHSSK